MNEPKILLLLGIPDGMTGTGAAKGEPLALRGNTGIVAALAETLRERKWPSEVRLLRPRMDLRTDAKLLINAVCEPAVQRRSLQVLARAAVQLPRPTLNPWWAVAGTGRATISKRLSHQVGVRVPLCTVLRPGIALTEHVERVGHRYPVLVRPLGEHGSKGLTRLDDAAAARAHKPSTPANVTDFVNFHSADGLYRKYRIFYAGDRLIRRHLLVDTQWNLTVEARAFMKDQPALIEEEKRWLAAATDLAPGSVDARILHQFRALQLDFGSVDFGILPGGEIVIFEINACIQVTGSVTPEEAKRWGYVEATKAAVIESVLELARRRAARAPQRQLT